MTKKLFQTLSIIALSLTFCLFFIPLSQATDPPPCTDGACIPDPPDCTDGPCLPPILPCSNGDCIPEPLPCSNGGCGSVEECTRTQGYWKTHSDSGPAGHDETWDKLSAELRETYYLILWTNGSAGPYYILAHQYIAAELNILNGASMNDDVQDAFLAAGFWLVKWSPEQMLSAPSSYREEIIDLAAILDDYNNGFIGPGACLDD
jgi:hypothetical protein